MAPKELNNLTRRIIGCAMEVHRQLGPGLLESLYEDALCYEFKRSKIKFVRQMPVPVFYRNEITLSTPLKLDVLVENQVVVEIKSVESIHPVHEAQLVSYLRIAHKTVGLLINFNVVVLKQGLKRKVNNFAEPPQNNSALSVSSAPSALK